MVSELGSLKFTTINLLPALWMLKNPTKTSPSTPLWSNVTSQILQFQGVHQQACILYKPLRIMAQISLTGHNKLKPTATQNKNDRFFGGSQKIVNLKLQKHLFLLLFQVASSLLHAPFCKEGMEPWKLICESCSGPRTEIQ